MCELNYEISVAPSDEGRLIAVNRNGTPEPVRRFKGQRCWEYFAGGTQPCRDCPVFKTSLREGRAPARFVKTERGAYPLVKVTRQENRASISVLTIFDDALGALIDDKLKRLAESSGLSGQEEAVFLLSAKGEQRKEIAAAMKLSPRTVKFHHENVLRKLGIRARLELLKLIQAPLEDTVSGRRRTSSG